MPSPPARGPAPTRPCPHCGGTGYARIFRDSRTTDRIHMGHVDCVCPTGRARHALDPGGLDYADVLAGRTRWWTLDEPPPDRPAAVRP
jgi:hypothetical protein